MPKVEICPSNFFVYRPIIRLYLIYIIHYQYKKSIEVRKTYLVPQRSYYNNTVTHFYGHYDNRLTSALKSSRMSI